VSVTPLGRGGEFDIIRRILADAAEAPGRVALAAGDDCALITCGDGYLAVSVDLTVAGAHYLPAWGDGAAVGRRAALAAISDLAAMAADPLAVLVSISLPADSSATVAEQIGQGARAAAEELGASLIGGDISRGGTGLAVDVMALGEVNEPLLRSRVRPGDELFVTGRLGAAAAAVAAWKRGAPAEAEWERRFWEPRPRVAEARWLRERGAEAAIDLSDGLVADAGHLAAASGVALEIDAEAVPADAGVELPLALAGGEDFELLVGVAGGIFGEKEATEFEREFGIPLSLVGRAVSGSDVRVFRGGEEVKVEVSGFDHFRLEAGS